MCCTDCSVAFAGRRHWGAWYAVFLRETTYETRGLGAGGAEERRQMWLLSVRRRNAGGGYSDITQSYRRFAGIRAIPPHPPARFSYTCAALPDPDPRRLCNFSGGSRTRDGGYTTGSPCDKTCRLRTRCTRTGNKAPSPGRDRIPSCHLSDRRFRYSRRLLLLG